MKHIFIVEDDEHIRELIQYLLMRKKYVVESFSTAEEFKTGITAKTPDLILLDIMLPDGNGLEICKGLSQSDQTSHIPVVLMSAHTNPNLSEESCASDFIAKPFDVTDLLARVHQQLV